MNDLKARMPIATLSVVAVSLLIYFSKFGFMAYVYTLVFTALVAIAQWEFYQLGVAKNFKPFVYLGLFTGVGYIWALFFKIQYNISYPLPLYCLAGALFLFFIFSFKYQLEPIVNIAISFLGLAYVIVPLAFILKITFSQSLGISGRWWVMYLIVITKVADIGAYFSGVLFGKHLLAEKISPKKTWEGFFGGLSLAIASSFILIYLSHARDIFTHTWLFALVTPVVLAILGQISDISESLLKRDAKVKDSNQMKGVGGVLDMLDSLIFTAPLFSLFLSLI